jgi:hypothetical protein
METPNYYLSLWNCSKETPKNYNNMVIPKIENLINNNGLKHYGENIKNKIYNYIIYYYNKGIKKGFLESIYIYGEEGEKHIYFNIKKKSIDIKLITKNFNNI